MSDPDPTYPIQCSGPGPHDPPDGVLGTSSVPGATGLCPSCAALIVPPPPPEPIEATDLPNALALLNAVVGQLVANGLVDGDALREVT